MQSTLAAERRCWSPHIFNGERRGNKIKEERKQEAGEERRQGEKRTCKRSGDKDRKTLKERRGNQKTMEKVNDIKEDIREEETRKHERSVDKETMGKQGTGEEMRGKKVRK